jgi:hypothetical protein
MIQTRRDFKIFKVHKNIILPVAVYGFETWYLSESTNAQAANVRQ